MTFDENLWRETNEKLAASVDACQDSDEFKTWLAGLDDKCKHCPVADGRFSEDELTKRRSLFCCQFTCPRPLVLTYWDEHGVDICGKCCNG